MTVSFIKITRESANDSEVYLREVLFENGSYVEQGNPVFEVEGEKTVYELVADTEGYIYVKEGLEIDESYEVDEVMAIITPSKIDESEVKIHFEDLEKQKDDENELIEPLEFQINPAPKGELIKKIGIIGGGRGFSQIIEINDSLENPYEIVCIYDDGLYKKINQKYNVPIIGNVDFSRIINDFNNKLIDGLIISVSTSNSFRQKCFEELSNNIPFVNMIHHNVALPKNYSIGYGNVILPNIHIGINCNIGNNNFVSSFCNLEHHCKIGHHNTFGPGVMMSGGVNVGNEVKFGTGIFIEPKINISSKQYIKSFQLINKDT